jgi:acetyl-CoA decarbonylase/synthase complex subunit gamma
MKDLEVLDWIETRAGKVPVVPATLSRADRWGGAKAILGLNRMRYAVQPGLYAIGNPGEESPVLATANYKLTFDTLRSNLEGLDAWIMVLDTRGINVWCAAGKGTFGTAEMVERIVRTGLRRTVSHREILAPQLGATGVAAHEVRKRSGFKVIFGPVRASDIPEFLGAGMVATREMRRVRFPLLDRLRLAPVDIGQRLRNMLIVIAVLAALSGLSRSGYSFGAVLTDGLRAGGLLLAAYLAANVLGLALLPWLPGRSFSFKGFVLGILLFAAALLAGAAGAGLIENAAWALMICSLSSFIVMNFTGCSTYTSLSGVRKEMRIALPLQIASAIIGIGLWVTARLM